LVDTSLDRIDLSSCTLHYLRLSPDLHELKGARVSEEQAAELMRLLGIKVTIKSQNPPLPLTPIPPIEHK
jgi:hypothetical protein